MDIDKDAMTVVVYGDPEKFDNEEAQAQLAKVKFPAETTEDLTKS